MIYWMWNDCWPAASGWAFVDYYCLPKASFYAFKRCVKPLLASIEKDDDYLIHVCNRNKDEEIKIEVQCITEDSAHTLLTSTCCDRNTINIPEAEVPLNGILVCDIQTQTANDRAFYKSGTLPIQPCTAPQIIAQSDNSISLKAQQYIHAVELEGSYLFSDNFFSMLPGEIRTIQYRPAKEVTDENLSINAYTISFEE